MPNRLASKYFFKTIQINCYCVTLYRMEDFSFIFQVVYRLEISQKIEKKNERRKSHTRVERDLFYCYG